MKIVRYIYKGEKSFGILKDENRILDLKTICLSEGKIKSSNINDLIILGSKIENFLEKLTGSKSDIEECRYIIKKEEDSLLAPVVNPPKIICVDLNYKDHTKESGLSLLKEPIFFMKPRTAIIGPEESIIKPKTVHHLDYEVELAFVIGKKGNNITLTNTEKNIFGYTVFNDNSALQI